MRATRRHGRFSNSGLRGWIGGSCDPELWNARPHPGDVRPLNWFSAFDTLVGSTGVARIDATRLARSAAAVVVVGAVPNPAAWFSDGEQRNSILRVAVGISPGNDYVLPASSLRSLYEAVGFAPSPLYRACWSLGVQLVQGGLCAVCEVRVVVPHDSPQFFGGFRIPAAACRKISSVNDPGRIRSADVVFHPEEVEQGTSGPSWKKSGVSVVFSTGRMTVRGELLTADSTGVTVLQDGVEVVWLDRRVVRATEFWGSMPLVSVTCRSVRAPMRDDMLEYLRRVSRFPSGLDANWIDSLLELTGQPEIRRVDWEPS